MLILYATPINPFPARGYARDSRAGSRLERSAVLATSRQRRQYAVDQQKERFADVPENRVLGHPITGEMTVADLSIPGSIRYPSKYPDKVTAWTKSVAEHRFLADQEQ